MKHSGYLHNTIILIALTWSSFNAIQADAQNLGDHRSTGSGNWNSVGTWERFNGTEFVPAAIVPTDADGVITIRAGHTVTASTFFTADQVVVESGGTLSHSAGAFTVADGVGDDIQVFGSLIHSGNSFSGPGNIRIMSGGTFQWTGGGQLNPDLTIDLAQGSTASSNSTSPLLNNGTINNGGTWTLVNGGFSSTVQPSTFHNLSTGIVDLNGWTSPTNSWAQSTINDGIINKNNGGVTFTTSGRPWTNNGTINVPQGTFTVGGPGANSNAGDIVFGGTGTVLRTNAPFTHAAGGSITGLGHLQLQSNSCTMEAGSSMNTLDTLTIATFSTLVVNEDIDAEEVDFTGGTINGSASVTVLSGGRFDWTGGNNSATLNIGTGAIATFLTTANVSNSGIINNGGTFLMQGGTLGQVTTPCRFNNLPGGILELNGWASTTNSWVQNVFNQGTINKNNGDVQFTLVFQLTNEPGGVVNVNSGSLSLAPSFSLPVQSGVFNVEEGTSLSTSASGIPYTGPEFNNNGMVNASLRFQGSTVQQLNGTGTITSLTIDNPAGVDLGGDQTVTNTLTLTNGQLRLGDNDLFVGNNAVGAVAGGNASSWVVNDASGSLHRQVNGNNYLFPVGTDSYTPLTLSLTNGAQERFSVRVQDGVSREYGASGIPTGSLLTSDMVDRTWVVSEEVAGGNTANITLQWNAADELASFGRSTCAVANYSAPDWVPGAFGPAIGNGPFTRTITGLGAFRELCVADAEAALNDINTGRYDRTTGYLKVFPVPASDVLHVSTPEGGSVIQVTLIDGMGRRIETRSTVNLDRSILDVSGLPSGTYVLELIDDREQVMRTQVIIAH